MLVINFREVIWDLLSQWKAILILALLVTCIMGGLKYAKDLRAYNDAQKKGADEVGTELSVEQQIEKVLESLPDDERMTVEYLSKQEDWLNSEKEYINNSILINTNPANQRTLALDYLILSEGSTESGIISLIDGYAGYLSNEGFLEPLGQAIDPDADIKYIAELVRTNNGNNASNEGEPFYINADDDKAVISVYIILPEKTDAESVENAVTAAFKNYSKDLNNNIGKHSISLIQSGESYQYNADLIESRTDLLYSIYNLTNNAKNIKVSLSDSQKAAVENITAIKKASLIDGAENSAAEESVDAQKDSKPGLNKKHAMFFVLGILGYVFVYLLIVLMKGCISSASESEYYSRIRLLGEIYGSQESKGISKLLHSPLVGKIRYRGKTNDDLQVRKAVETMDAVCEHTGTRSFMLLDITRGTGRYVKAIIEGAKARGMSVDIIDAVNDFNEKSLLSTDNAVLVTGPDTKVSVLSEMMSLCSDYDISMLGSIFIDPTALS